MNLDQQQLSASSIVIFIFSGVGATIIGFLLAFLYDFIKSKKQDKIITKALENELTINIDILKKNSTYLEEELSLLEQHKNIVKPVNLLNDSALNLFLFRTPRKINKSVDVILKFKNISKLTTASNDTIRSRENYRINNQAMTNYEERLEKYDKELLRSSKELLQAIHDFVDLLKC